MLKLCRIHHQAKKIKGAGVESELKEVVFVYSFRTIYLGYSSQLT
ncbi:hypothetical protein GALL_262380 [mine drainage metagenome]|uniref:Uncharacterized protein n=1 Tax=mine drainage metagenome TaxID=410659 RepID=A0A1J5RQV8_9ZZZZ